MALSQYEIQRARNVERHNERLRQLGLISAVEAERSNAAAWKKPYVSSTAADSVIKPEPAKESRKRKSAAKKRGAGDEPQSTRGRKSLRLQGLQPDGAKEVVDENDAVHKETLRERRAVLSREARQQAALKTSELGFDKAAQENRTATYEHCLMRVRTMSEKALANRIRTIERRAGKHSVVKMAIFKCCLHDEGMEDLSKSASEALERLKALEPPPED